MKTDYPWVNQFNLDTAQVQEWKASVPQGQSLLEWCLENEKIDSAKYFEWAQDHYGLAYLSATYFSSDNSAAETFNKMKDIAPWSQSLLPVCEWDGVVFIACVEPHPDAKWSFPVQYILASPQAMKQQFDLLNPSFEAPEGLSLDLSFQAEPMPEQTADFEKTNSDEPSYDAPEGLNLTVSSPQPPDWDVATIPPMISNTQVKASKEIPNRPLPAEESEVNEMPLKPKAPDANLSQQAESFKVQLSNAKKINEAQNEEELFIWAMAELRKFFAQTMTLLATETGYNVWKFDETWEPQTPEALVGIDVDQPSLFRISFRSNLPYHGPVMACPLNDSFFNAWGMKLPEHATLVPILSAGHQIACILCVGDKSCNSLENLKFAENVAQQLAQALAAKTSTAA